MTEQRLNDLPGFRRALLDQRVVGPKRIGVAQVMVAVSGNQDLANLAGIRVRLGDPFGQPRFHDGSAKCARERVRPYGFTRILVRIHTVHEKHLGLIALLLKPVASGNGNALAPFPVDIGVQVRNKIIRYVDVARHQSLGLRAFADCRLSSDIISAGVSRPAERTLGAFRRFDPRERAVLAVPLALMLVLGVYPQAELRVLNGTVTELVQQLEILAAATMLSWTIYLSFLGAALLLAVPAGRARAARIIALFSVVAGLACGIVGAVQFTPGTVQTLAKVPWIPSRASNTIWRRTASA